MLPALSRWWRFSLLLLSVQAGFVPGVRAAEAGWFESGDAAMRMDLQLLNDAEIIRLPVNHWPLPRAAVAHAIENARESFAINGAVIHALARVRARLTGREGTSPFAATMTIGQAGLLRDFDSNGREDAELVIRAQGTTEHAAVSLRVSGVLDPEDGREIRADGSHATLRLGNWLLSANTLDRFWGPAHDSSLILSNNARPIPTLMVERAVPMPFESPWLEWLGPWRFSFGIGKMEDDRADIDSPLFMSWRVAIMPLKDVELGFSRTAQFCGKQLACNFDTFANMLAGNDNVGIDATAEDEPGNQMAGFDIRWASPIGSWPYAVYSQLIGEDESSYLPAKYLAQFGLETWKTFGDGALAQTWVEFADTTCSANRSQPRFGCAYNQGRFSEEGYRYRGRVIGHTTDRDAESIAAGVSYINERGALWTVAARKARLNRDPVFDPTNTVSAVPADHLSLELGWRGDWRRQQISVQVGVEAFTPDDEDRQLEPFGFLSWTYPFPP